MIVIKLKMEKIIILLIFTSCLTVKSQNSTFYKVSDLNTEVEFYKQININPVVLKFENVTSENDKPNWYEGFQFNMSPGVFSSYIEMYNYLSDNDVFIDNSAGEYSYYNKNNSEAMVENYNNGKEALERVKDYSEDEALNDSNLFYTSRMRYQVVFEELYIKYKTHEFLFLLSGDMFTKGLDPNNTNDLNKVLQFLKQENNNGGFDSGKDIGLLYSILIKENTKWKFMDANSFFKYSNSEGFYNVVKAYVKNEPNLLTVESTVNSLGNRIYVEK
jgi:hypothetical protein